MKKGYYKCECGKEFDNPQKFNGHKAHCKVHLELTGHLELRQHLQNNLKAKATENNLKKSKDKAALEHQKWIEEKHICEHCGKIMTEKYGSGRFCSRACANSRIQTEEINAKRKASHQTKESPKHIKALKEYEANPKICPICKKPLSYERRYRSTCGELNCEHSYRSLKSSLAHKEGRNKGWLKRNTLSFPEKFWIQVLNNNNIYYKTQVKVVYSEKKKYYFLDFVINDKIDLEIDGKQHNSEESKLRDKERDAFVSSLGYIVYRIPWKGVQNKEILKEQVDKLLTFIQGVV